LVSDITSPLIEAAAADALHAHGACEDMIAVLFPKGRQLPSEELQAAVGAKFHDLIFSIEFALLDGEDATGFSHAWQTMVQSGALRQKSLLSFILARVSEERLVARLTAQSSSAALSFLPARLIGHANETVARLARNLLSSEQAGRSSRKSLFAQLEPPLLSMMVWKVAEALYLAESVNDEAVKCKAQELLVNHQVANQLSVAAQKLLFAIGSDFRQELINPARAGLHLFVAALAREFSMPHDTIIRMIDAETAAPFAMLLAMRGLTRHDAIAQIQALRGQGRDDSELASLFGQFESVSAESARRVLSRWRGIEEVGNEA
jgi:hypothetical protein